MNKLASNNIGTVERENYEEAISNLAKANSLVKLLLTLILILAGIAIVLLYNNGQEARREAALASTRQEQLLIAQEKVLREVQHSTEVNVDQIQRVLNYLNCIGTVPIEERTQELIAKCFEDATPPKRQSGVVPPSPGGFFNLQQDIDGTMAVQPAISPQAATTPAAPTAETPQPSPSRPPAPPPAQPTPPAQPAILDVITGVVDDLRCNVVVVLKC